MNSPFGSVQMLPPFVSHIENGFRATPTFPKGFIGNTATASMDRSVIHETLRRRRLMEASLAPTLPNNRLQDDAAYMTALASLKHREAMLSLDRAIHEAEKRRYTSMAAVAAHRPNSFSHHLPGELSSGPEFSFIPYGSGLSPNVGGLSRGVSIPSSSSSTSSLRERSLLRWSLDGSGNRSSPSRTGIQGTAALHFSHLPMSLVDLPYHSASLAARSRERLDDVQQYLKSPSRTEYP